MRTPARGLATKAAVALTAVGVFVVADPAFATIKGPQTTTVSCNAVTIKTGVKVNHRLRGTFSIKQVRTSPTSRTKTWAVSATGNSLSAKTIGNGGTAKWTQVLPSRYTVKALRAAKSNCNGVLPGHGNYNWTYTVTYRG
jgi:hypothetical protein